MSKMPGVWNSRHKIRGKDNLIISIFAKGCSSLKDYLQKKYQDQQWKYPIVNQLSWANSRIECSYAEIMYHWTVRKSDCWSWEDVSPVLEDARYGKWRGPWPAPHTILPLSTIYIEPSSTSTTLQFISTTLLQLYSYIKSSFFKINRLHFYLSENSSIHSLQMFWVVALIEHTDIN